MSVDKDDELREMLGRLSSSGAHACYCPRSTDGGCTCALKDEYVEEILQLIHARGAEIHKTALDSLADVCMYLVPKSEQWIKCHEKISYHLDQYNLLKYGKTLTQASEEYLAQRQSQLKENKEKK